MATKEEQILGHINVEIVLRMHIVGKFAKIDHSGPSLGIKLKEVVIM